MPKKFDPMEKKIYDAGMIVKADCASLDLTAIIGEAPVSWVPDAINDFEYFLNLLVHAGDRKMFSARDRALKKLVGQIK